MLPLLFGRPFDLILILSKVVEKLRERIESDIRKIKKWFGEMKKISLLKFLSICGKGNKSDIPEESLLTLTNKMSRKVMVSAAIL